MEIIAGKRKDSYLYIYEGFTYNIDKRYKSRYRCAKRRVTTCRGVLVKEKGKFILHNSHNHPSEPNVLDIFNLKNEMIRMCKETNASNKEIFDTVSQKNPEVAANLSFHAVRTLLLRERTKVRPSLPSNVCDFDDLLKDYGPIKSIYKGCITSKDNKCCFIFTSDKLLKILEKSSEIFIDNIFSIVPKTPNFTKLFSIHVRYNDKGIAVLFVLCEARTQLVYESIWKEVIKLAPDLLRNLRFIICNYDEISMNVVQERFPHASVHGCWFRYCQAVLKKWKQLELLTASNTIVSMAMTLALAPSEMFSEGLNIMQLIADTESDDYPNMLFFMKYMRTTWLPISQKISVYGCPIRVNNVVESFHDTLRKMHMVHPNFWVFIDKISKIIRNQEINYNHLINNKNNLQVTKDRNQFNKYKNEILKAQNYLSTGMYSLTEFLQLFEKENLHKHHKTALLIDDANEMEMCDSFKDGTAG